MPIPKDAPKMERISAKQRALEQIQRWIIEGTLRPGEKILDCELAEALGVSRTPVREALQILEMQGFVEMHPGSATRVTPIRREDVYKIYPPLAALEATAAELAADRVTEEDIRSLRLTNEKFADALGKKSFYEALILDEQFHQTILEAADNPYLTSFITTLQMHVRRFKYVFIRRAVVSPGRSIEEHAMIIDALESRDKEKAARVMKQNWLRPMREIADRLQREEGEGQEGE
ncbi:DNA-binding GntR family transcriptional regulator [Planifilum fimeticola]|uniref:DNA-binding GntR family transcriptional regulator n=1 Tax=Planifilum fimeticola TaxID=201975 RepID=A0A2T0LIC9_9BACL|nr:GntR family transcriptional regulator [Planifilum fimeticola]PRX42173.1 DNA-binding GntR family transcriptional regulator [Planifilum fimeticola]